VPPEVEGGPTNVRKLLYIYGQCVVDTDRKRLEVLLVSDLNGRAFQRWRRSLGSDCLFSTSNDGYVALPDWASLRFVLADLIVRPVVGQLTPEKLATIGPLALPTGPNTFGDARALEVGECLVRGSPEGAARVLRSTPNSEAEMMAVESFVHDGYGCGKGQKFAIDVNSLRGAVAMAYFRLAKSAGIPAQQRAVK